MKISIEWLKEYVDITESLGTQSPIVEVGVFRRSTGPGALTTEAGLRASHHADAGVDLD